MPVASDDVVWLDVLPSMNRFRPELEKQTGPAADSAGTKAGGAFTGAFGKALKLGAVVGGALAVAGAANFLKEATREASNLGESLNAVRVTFGDAAGGINELGKAAAESVGLSQSQFNSLAVQFSAFATTIAGDGGDVTGVMKDLTTRGADFASVMNLDVNQAMELFQSGLAGETEPLRKYGIDLSAAAVENYALANGIAESAGTMTEAQKVQARYAFLMEQTSKVQGDFQNTSDSLANSQRILGARWDDIQAMVGMKVIPVLERFSGWVLTTGLPMVMQLGGWMRDNLLPVFRGLGDFISGTLAPALKDVGGVALPLLWGAFQTVGSIVSSTVGFFREHETAAKILGGTVAFVAGLVVAAWVTQAAVSAINAAKSVAAWYATATASTTSATIQSRSTAQIVVGWVAAAAGATVNAVKIVAAWAVSVAQTGILMAMYASQSIAAAATSSAAWVAAQVRTVASLVVAGATFVAQGAVMLASMAVTAAGVVAGWVVMGVQSMIQAARMAAAWLIAMGPVGWVIAAVVGLVALIIANWDTVVRWTKIAWDAVMGAISAAWEWIKSATSVTWAWITNLLVTTFAWVVGSFVALQNNVIATAQFLWNGVKAVFDALWRGVVAIFTGVRDTVVAIWNGFRDVIVAVATWIWERVVWYFTTLRNGVVTIFTAVRDTVVGIWNGFRDTLVNGAQTAWNWVTERFNRLRDSAVSIFTEIRDTVGRVWDGLVEAVKKPIRIVFGYVNDSMIDPINSLLGKFPGNLRIPRIPGFQKGGYTGDGHRDEAKGIVHAGEYVFTQEQVRRLGLPRIEAIANGAIPRQRERDIGGPFDDFGDFGVSLIELGVTGAKLAAKSVASAYDFTKELASKAARKVAEEVLNPLANAAKRSTPDNIIGNMLDGAIDRLMQGVLGKSDEQDKAKAAAAAAAATTGGGSFGGAAGAGAVGGGWTSIWNYVKARIPQARINSTYRAGDPGYHGRNKAIDFGFGSGPGGLGSAGLASIKRVLHDGIGGSLAELIYNGVGNDRNNLKNGRPLAYNRATQLAHRNHVHAAVYDRGGLWEPGTAGFNFTGGIERVLTPPQDDYFRRFVHAAERGRQGALIGALHLPMVASNPHEAMDEVVHQLRLLEAGGRYGGVDD